VPGLHVKCLLLLSDFNERTSNTEFYENPSGGSRVVPCGQRDGQTNRRSDRTKLIVAFRNFANVPKIEQISHPAFQLLETLNTYIQIIFHQHVELECSRLYGMRGEISSHLRWLHNLIHLPFLIALDMVTQKPAACIRP